MLQRRWLTLATLTTLLFHGFLLLIFGAIFVVGLGAYSSYEHASAAGTGHQIRYPSTPQGPLNDDLGATLYAEIDGKAVQLPMVDVDYDVDIRGDLAHVVLKQRFENPAQSVMQANYEFPLNPKAAIHKMVMVVGERRVVAEIQRKEEAQNTFDAAQESGKKAALLIQERPNVFSQSIANVQPGEAIEVELEYVQALNKFGGKYELSLPLVVGERFNPGDMSGNTLGSEEFGAIVKGDSLDSGRVSIDVRVDGDFPIEGLESSSHTIRLRTLSPSDITLALAGNSVANRNFDLKWGYETADPAGALISSWDETHGIGHASLLIEAPKLAPQDVQAREMVFLLDCSGSMGGAPMEASKAFMKEALRNLRPTDTFRVIRFSETSSEFSATPLIATPENIERGLAYVEDLKGGGGTYMTDGITRALDEPGEENTLRLVTFLTDGYIGNDFEVLKLVDERIGNSRLFAIGVGQGVNTYLLDEIGSRGRGFTRYIDPNTENLEAAANELAERLHSPVLTDIEVNFDGRVSSVYPSRIPDLFTGQSIRLVGTYTQAGPIKGTITGTANGKRVTLPIHAELSSDSTRGAALRNVWARARVHTLMQDLMTQPAHRASGESDAALQESVTQMGLEYRLMTQWTAFVAVDHTPQLPEYASLDTAQTKSYVPSFGAAPEPGTIGGLLVLLGGGALSRRRKKKQDGQDA